MYLLKMVFTSGMRIEQRHKTIRSAMRNIYRLANPDGIAKVVSVSIIKSV
jgi:hypothetical protein